MRALSENKNQMAAGMNPMNSMGQPGGLMGAAAGQGKEQKQIFKPQIDGLQLISHNFIFRNSNKDALMRLKEFLKK